MRLSAWIPRRIMSELRKGFDVLDVVGGLVIFGMWGVGGRGNWV